LNSYINKKFSYEDSPKTEKEWINSSEIERKNFIKDILLTHPEYNDFEIIKTEKNGSVVLKTEKQIQASERGIFLLKLEQILKDKVDQGITIWLEPVGDKSKLRNLRGIVIK